MSGRTWLMMILILALNWGGFVVSLWYAVTHESTRQKPD
jgi:hypothetical protein